MPAKNKECHVFAVGDAAQVRRSAAPRRGSSHEIVCQGKIVSVKPGLVTFQGPASDGRLEYRTFRRKGKFWVQLKRDHYILEPNSASQQ